MELKEIQLGVKLELEMYDDMGDMIVPPLVSQYELALDEKTAIIAAPIRESVIFPIHIGAIGTAVFIQKDDLYKFKFRVLGRGTKENIAYLKIELPGEIIKIQRRQFFRFEYGVPVRYRVVNQFPEAGDIQEQPMKDAVTRDLSGGGICIKLEEEVKLREIIECEVSLGEKKKISFIGKVVRSSRRNNDLKYGYEIGVIFQKIGNTDREAVIGFIFEVQRKLRKKGLI
jgi:c-di-GMP-binding flagellar brake protein YcgR